VAYTSQGGDFQGAGSSCDAVECTVGACCFPDGTCQQLTAFACDQAGGDYRGDDVTCAIADCDDGVCCRPDGSCVVTAEPRCAVLGGEFKGIGTTCDDPFICLDLPGACCLPGGECVSAQLEVSCIQLGGVWQGEFTSCSPTLCPQPGACCFPFGMCEMSSEVGGADCAALGGEYQGDGTTCDDDPCSTPLTAGCTADLTGDGRVDVADLVSLLTHWGICDLVNESCPDLDADGIVGSADVLQLLTAWGSCGNGSDAPGARDLEQWRE
jgi:hypothetical protein